MVYKDHKDYKDHKTHKGEIKRKAYDRKAYVRYDGTKVSATHVPAGWIADRGRPGKSKNTIPKESLKKIPLKYHLNDTSAVRHKAIRQSVKKHGSLKTLQKINALRTLQKSNEKNYKKLGKDLAYIQKLHAHV